MRFCLTDKRTYTHFAQATTLLLTFRGELQIIWQDFGGDLKVYSPSTRLCFVHLNFPNLLVNSPPELVLLIVEWVILVTHLREHTMPPLLRLNNINGPSPSYIRGAAGGKKTQKSFHTHTGHQSWHTQSQANQDKKKPVFSQFFPLETFSLPCIFFYFFLQNNKKRQYLKFLFVCLF